MTDENKTPLPDQDQADDPEIAPAAVAEENTSEQSVSSTRASRKKYLWLIGVLLLILLIAFGLWKSYRPQAIELQGRVEVDTVQVATKVPSRILELYVHEGEPVKKGQVLVKLHSPEIEAKKQQALASLQSALALQSTAERGSQQENIDSLYANWQSLKAQQHLANISYQRGENLFKEGVISRQRRDELSAAAQSSTQMTEAAYQQYKRAARGSTPEQKNSADAQVEIAQAAVAEANALEAETELLAPIDGTVSKTYGHASELVAAAVPVVSLISEHRWVSLNIREDQYSALNQHTTLSGFIPALKQTVDFKVENISVEGEFATIKTTRQTGGYDVRSFKVHLIPKQPIPQLRAGMSVLFELSEPQ